MFGKNNYSLTVLLQIAHPPLLGFVRLLPTPLPKLLIFFSEMKAS